MKRGGGWVDAYVPAKCHEEEREDICEWRWWGFCGVWGVCYAHFWLLVVDLIRPCEFGCLVSCGRVLFYSVISEGGLVGCRSLLIDLVFRACLVWVKCR